MEFLVILGLGIAWIVGVVCGNTCCKIDLDAVPTQVQQTSPHPDPSTTGDAPDTQVICRMTIPPGLEVFSPNPIPSGGWFKLEFRGSYVVKRSGYAAKHGLDACYTTDDNFNFRQRHSSLLIDGAAQAAKVAIEEDRAAHRYVFLYEGTGERLAVLLDSPLGGPFDTYEQPTGAIELTVTALTSSEISAFGLDAAERQREQDVQKRALEWATLAHLGSNFLNPDYRRDYVERNAARILSTYKQQWLNEYQQLISDTPLYELVKTEHEQVLAYFEARFTVVQLAEWKVLEPAPDAKPNISPEEWAARIERYRQRSLTRKRVKVEDYKADVMQDLELLQEFTADLDSYPLDEDERERLIQEFKERLLSGEEESGNNFRQL